MAQYPWRDSPVLLPASVIRQRAKTQAVHEERDCGNGWYLERMRLYGMWLATSFPQGRPAYVGTLTEALRHMAAHNAASK